MAGPDARLDYALHTHFHPDHMGIITGSEPLSIHGDYRLRGITEVSELLPYLFTARGRGIIAAGRLAPADRGRYL
jgi:glyoxylase-like metal-dependent hydrolase (beta-lactamase superfamily II)